jgi:hypothetical protein
MRIEINVVYLYAWDNTARHPQLLHPSAEKLNPPVSRIGRKG